MKTMITNFEVHAQKLQSMDNLLVYRGVYLGRATFSTSADGDSNNLNPVVTYENSEIQKDQILQENKGKCGVYRLTNIDNKKTYVGSARNLRTRFYVYYSTSRLASSNMVIYKAILKYGYSNFTLEILEYCDPKDVLKIEQHYIDLLNPQYNILSKAGSSFGYKHTKEALEKMSAARSAYTGYNLSDETRAKLAVAATGRVLSEETKAKISAARMGIKLSDETRAKLSAATAAIHGVAVEVTNIKTGEIKQFSTMTEAAAYLGVSRTTVKKTIQSRKIFRDSYSITGSA
jgi:group I intron endonuclease